MGARQRHQEERRDALLTTAFPGDDQGCRWIAGELNHAQHPFLMAMRPPTWQNIAVNFRDHPVVVDAGVRSIPDSGSATQRSRY